MSENPIILTVEIPLDKLRDAVLTVVSAEMANQNYGQRPGVGYRAIEEAVKRELLNFDYAPLIQLFARARIESVVDDIVTQQLRERAKAKARELARSNQLFGENT